MTTLLVTDIPPCSNFTAGVATAQICRAFPENGLVTFAIINTHLEPIAYPDLVHIPTYFYGKPNENYAHSGLQPEEIFACEEEMRQAQAPRLVAAAESIASRSEITQVLAVLQGQTMVRVSRKIAHAFGVPLRTIIWDPLDWWHDARDIDPRTRELDNRELDETLRESAFVAAPSWAMAEEITAAYGSPSAPIIASLPRAAGQPSATGLLSDDQLIIGMAGQFYASDAWLAFCLALDSISWRMAGRTITINVYGTSSPPNETPPGRLVFRGWVNQNELVAAIARECDLCYCPYPFAEAMEKVSRLSFPSKVVVYLASGRPVFFHGPDYSSPGIYLAQHDAAILCRTLAKDEILTRLQEFIDRPDEYRRLAANGTAAFYGDFTIEQQGELVRKCLMPGSPAERAPGGARLPDSRYAYFDPWYYWKENPEVRGDERGIFGHYVEGGWRDGRGPLPLFSTLFYLGANPDVREAGLEPLDHYLRYGWREGRDPHQLFSAQFYLDANPAVREAGLEPLDHYVRRGWREGRDPHPLFSTRFYLDANPKVREDGLEPLDHYLRHGWRVGRDPHPLFSTRFYLDANPDVREAGLEPLDHYLRHGWREGRDPHPLFSSQSYLDANPDVREAGLEPLGHYLRYGWREGREPCRWFSSAFYRGAGATDPNIDPLSDFVNYGEAQGRDPAPWFSTRFYREKNQDAIAPGETAIQHYVTRGWRERRDPNPWFPIGPYLDANPQLCELGVEPMTHFLEHGLRILEEEPRQEVSETFVETERLHAALQRVTRENDRLRTELRSPIRATLREPLDPMTAPEDTYLALAEQILLDVGTRAKAELESRSLPGDEVVGEIWGLVHGISMSIDEWLRAKFR